MYVVSLGMAVRILICTKKRIMLSIVENKGRVHVRWLVADIHLHGDKLHGNIKAYLIDGNGGIFIHFSGNAV